MLLPQSLQENSTQYASDAASSNGSKLLRTHADITALIIIKVIIASTPLAPLHCL
jgi:hypothetical protein